MFKAMLATDAVFEKLRYPLFASPKLDGIRATVRESVAYSRSNKPLPNAYVQSLFTNCEYFDGELLVGEPTSKTVYRDTVSHVMSNDKTNFDVRFYVFDHIENLQMPWSIRIENIRVPRKAGNVIFHQQTEILNEQDLLAYEEHCLTLGYEGLILRDPDAPYKLGRSTANEGYLLKLKRFLDAEATVVGFEERQQNNNEKVTNELGRSARSSHQAGKTGRGDLGALYLRTDEGVSFACGTGFTDSERAEIWSNQDAYLGRLAKYKFFPVGVKDAPRHPVFLGWRDRSDT